MRFYGLLPRLRSRTKLSYDNNIQTEMTCYRTFDSEITSDQVFQTKMTSNQTVPRQWSQVLCAYDRTQTQTFVQTINWTWSDLSERIDLWSDFPDRSDLRSETILKHARDFNYRYNICFSYNRVSPVENWVKSIQNQKFFCEIEVLKEFLSWKLCIPLLKFAGSIDDVWQLFIRNVWIYSCYSYLLRDRPLVSDWILLFWSFWLKARESNFVSGQTKLLRLNCTQNGLC